MKIRVIVKPELEKEILQNEDFLLAIQLSRIVNGLRSNMRTYLCVENNAKLIAVKDRLDLILIHGSMLFEAINVFISHGKKFKDLKVFEEKIEDFKHIQKQHGDKNSFKNTVLSRIRNRLFFHFDQNVVPETLSKIPFPDGITFLRAASHSNMDVIYTLADDIALTFLTGFDDTKKEGIEIYASIEKQIIDLSKNLGNLIDKIITELLEDKLVAINN